MELLTTVQLQVFGTLSPGKIAELFRLGDPGNNATGIATSEVLKGFYEFLGFPRLLSAEAVRKAVARGVQTGLFGYTTGRPQLGEDGRYLIDRTRVAFERDVADDEIDLDAGFLIVPAAMPEEPTVTRGETAGDQDGAGEQEQPADDIGGSDSDSGERPTGEGPGVVYPTDGREIAVAFVADQQSVYEAWDALANLAALAGTISIKASATAPEGYDKAKLENGVFEPLRELGLIDDEEDAE